MVVVSSLTVRTAVVPAVAWPAVKSVSHAAPPKRRSPRARPVAAGEVGRAAQDDVGAGPGAWSSRRRGRCARGPGARRRSRPAAGCPASAALRSSMCLCQRQKTWSRMAATGLFITPSPLGGQLGDAAVADVVQAPVGGGVGVPQLGHGRLHRLPQVGAVDGHRRARRSRGGSRRRRASVISFSRLRREVTAAAARRWFASRRVKPVMSVGSWPSGMGSATGPARTARPGPARWRCSSAS